MPKMLGKKVYYGICVCRDCGNINSIKFFKKSEKLREERSWRRYEMSDLWKTWQ